MRPKANFLLVSIPILALAFVLPLFADSSNKFWLLYEQGNTAAGQREFGKAMQLYKDAVQGAGIFPEAEAAIGDVYLEEGEADLAQRQYQKAYDERNAFYIPEMQYAILYKLANLFEMRQFYKQMEDSLSQIVADDKKFQDTSTQHLRTQVEKNFLEKGLDRVLVLYTFEDTFAAPAHSKLGWFYYRTGRFSPAVSNLLYSVIYRVSQVREVLKERDVEYEFSNVADLLSTIEGSSELRSYAQSTGLYKDIYYLAGSMFANGYPRHARDLWTLLKAAPSAGQYNSLAVRQLKKPFVEPLLTIIR
jgi:tetratricopeptide (TPR) repeat protein